MVYSFLYTIYSGVGLTTKAIKCQALWAASTCICLGDLRHHAATATTR